MNALQRFGSMLIAVILVTVAMVALSPVATAQTYGNDGERKFNAKQADSITFVIDSTLVEIGVTQAEMESPMMCETRVVEATPSISQRLWGLIVEHYVIAPLLILGVITAVYWLISKIHSLTI